jgi:hypothetical protein
MSNAERWDHSGFDGMMKDEKNMKQRGGVGQKKVFYGGKYKEGGSFNDKTMFSDYIDHNQNNRKPQNKKYPYGGKEGDTMGGEKQRPQVGVGSSQDMSFRRGGAGKKKKNEKGENYTFEEGTSGVQDTGKTFYKGYGEEQPQEGFVEKSGVNPGAGSMGNFPRGGGGSKNFGPNFYANKGYSNYHGNNSYGNTSGMGNIGGGMPGNIGNMGGMPGNNVLGGSGNNMGGMYHQQSSNEGNNVIIDSGVHHPGDGENEMIIMQQNNILSNENNKNKKNFKYMLDTLKANKKNHFNKRDDEKDGNITEENQSASNTPRGTPGGQMKTPTGGQNMGNFNSPKNDFFIPMPNLNQMMKMQNNFNFNSPMRQMNEQFMFPQGFQGNRNLNPQMMNMMGLSLGGVPMNAMGNPMMNPLENLQNMYSPFNYGMNMINPNTMNKGKNFESGFYKQNSGEDLSPKNFTGEKRGSFKKFSNSNLNYVGGGNTPGGSHGHNNYSNHPGNNTSQTGHQSHQNHPNQQQYFTMKQQQGKPMNNGAMGNHGMNMGSMNNQGFKTTMQQQGNNYGKKMMMPGQNHPMGQLYKMKSVKSEKNIVGSFPGNFDNLRNGQRWRGNQGSSNKLLNNGNNHQNMQRRNNDYRPLQNDSETNLPRVDVHDPYFNESNSSVNDSLDADETSMLHVVIKLNDRDEILTVGKHMDPLKLTREFCMKNQLSEYLIKPIYVKIKQAIKSLDQILEHSVGTNEERSLKEIQDYYSLLNNSTCEDDEMFNLSCITEIGDSCELKQKYNFEDDERMLLLNQSR